MFPSIHVEVPRPFLIFFYRKFLLYSSPDHQLPSGAKSPAPVYLGGYYEEDNDTFCRLFTELFINQPTPNIPFTFEREYPNQKVCAVHVRRGDLAKGDNPYYGGVSDDYFFKAIDYVEQIAPNSKYFIFSDGMDYVYSNIISRLSVSFRLMTDHYRAFEDLLLISKCDFIIASQGSFGKYAAMLNEQSSLIIQDDAFSQTWLERKQKSISI